MSVNKTDFGKTKDGSAVELYTLTNSHGLIAKVTNFGAILTELHVPDKSGKVANIVLGFDTLAPYEPKHPFFGATVGRYANRIGKGSFTLDGVTYDLAKNNGPNTLHGGKVGFDKKIWNAHPIQGGGSPGVKFTYLSPDGEENFPGTLAVSVTYTLSDENLLIIDYTATIDKPCPVNLTNHSYFNLNGAGQGDVLDHELTLFADHFTPVDNTQIPTGEIAAAKNTPMDFTKPAAIGSRIDQVKGGYDHNYVLNHSQNGTLALAARVRSPKTGRILEVSTTQPGVQLYTANNLDGTIQGIGGRYPKHGALCLETQHYPDSPNQPAFPSTILKPGQTYRHTTVHKFAT